MKVMTVGAYQTPVVTMNTAKRALAQVLVHVLRERYGDAVDEGPRYGGWAILNDGHCVCAYHVTASAACKVAALWTLRRGRPFTVALTAGY